MYWFGMPRDGGKDDQRSAQFRSAYKSEVGRAAGAYAYFIGIWDTVAAIGWQRFFSDWAYDRHFTSDVQYARHLPSIDEGGGAAAQLGSWGQAAAPRHLDTSVGSCAHAAKPE